MMLVQKLIKERDQSRKCYHDLANVVMKVLYHKSGIFDSDLAKSLHDISVAESWIIGLNFIESNIYRFSKGFVFNHCIRPPDHVALIITINLVAINVKNVEYSAVYTKTPKEEYLIFDGEDYTIPKVTINTWRLE